MEQKPIHGWEKQYMDKAEKLEIYCCSAESDSEIRGRLFGESPKEVIEIYKRINPCAKCGAQNPKALEYECMGDFDFSITCRKCGRSICRSMYDFDVKQPGEWIDLCIEDWNCGVDQEEIEAANKAERERKKLEEGNLIWKPWYANNMVNNPLEGYYCLLFRRLVDGKIYGCKWTIEFQYKQDEAGMVIPNDSEIEAYILFRTRYIDLETTFEYPEPQAEYVYEPELNPKCVDGVNDRGEFVRAFWTLEEAKRGVINDCGFYGFNKDTLR
ncbi:hypothetical protein [Butyrivibrio sp. WCE2006]|uniref:hypothetical protein n=1 Tax=Butyrivibrio sp. WCE2006 TaxID=1410611 RepID=UPI0005D1ED99|nr:hypothetical protein [Butyrivibrio sp. WCE2006]